MFLPPVLILKGVRKNCTILHGMPAGSDVYMNRKSSFINSDLFMKWLKEIFVPRKPDGPVILILDGHSSHCCHIDMLTYAESNNIILLCLPSHTTQALQPLDRSFFKPLKSYFKREADNFMFTNKTKVIDRTVIGKLIGAAWNKSATITNGTSGFSATGIYPFNDNIIPDYFFQVSDISTNHENEEQLAEDFLERDENYIFLFDMPDTGNVTDNAEQEVSSADAEIVFLEDVNEVTEPCVQHVSPSATTSAAKDDTLKKVKETPSKFLHEIAPLPQIPQTKSKKKQTAKILSSHELKVKIMNKDTQNIPKGKKGRKKEKSNLGNSVKKTNLRKYAQEKSKHTNTDDAKCTECLESYHSTQETVDWIQCINCKQWRHENSTMYGDNCNDCGRQMKRLNVATKANKNVSF